MNEKHDSPEILVQNENCEACHHEMPHEEPDRRLTWSLVGTGVLVAMGYLDPGNIEGDLSAGALRSDGDRLLGYRLLWIVLVSTGVGLATQFLAIRLSLETGADLSTLCRKHLPPRLRIVLFVSAQLCVISSDVQAVIGSAVAFNLLFGFPIPVGTGLTLLDVFLVLALRGNRSRMFESCFGICLVIMSLCFFFNMITSRPSMLGIAEGAFIPYIPRGSLSTVLGLVGCTVMPHVVFLQSSLALSTQSVDGGTSGRHRMGSEKLERVCKILNLEASIVVGIAMLVNAAIIVSFANSAVRDAAPEALTLKNAHLALTSALGKSAAVVWAIGLFSAGQCATLSTTLAAQYLMSGFWGIRVSRFKGALLTRTAAIVPLFGLLFLEEDTIDAITRGANVLQAINLPITVILLLRFASSVGGGMVAARGGRALLTTLTVSLAVVDGVFLARSCGPVGSVVVVPVYCVLLVWISLASLKGMGVEDRDGSATTLYVGCANEGGRPLLD